jgi:predicted ester cyclase
VIEVIPNTPPLEPRDIHAGIRNFPATFSDRHFTIEETIAEGDLVAAHTTLRGIHTGGFPT